MRASACVGPVAAVALGAAIVAGSAVAIADSDSRGPADSPATGAATAGPAPVGPGPKRSRDHAGDPAVRESHAIARAAAAVSVPGQLPRTVGGVTRARMPEPAVRVAGDPALAAQSHVVTASPASSAIVASATAARPQFAPRAVLVELVSAAAQFALAMGRQFSIGAVTPWRTTPTLTVNGYELLPASPQTVTGFYGRWAYFPGAPGMVQGQQQFNVVDPVTGETVATVDALVARGSLPNYTQVLITGDDGLNAGTGLGQVPPAGSIIASINVFGRFGWSYSALPSPSGDVVSFRIVTPFGDVPLPLRFNAAEGIADHTVDNRPMQLGNGYSIAPVEPAGETFTATSGLLPVFTAVQGYQRFGVYDSEGHRVGSFDGVFTTTTDIGVNYTQAILVTANDGINVGTDAGQTPPVGSVYNVIYTNSDDNWVLYSSLPSPSGDVVSVAQGLPSGRVRNISTWLLTRLDASAPPLVPALAMPRGNRFVPVSALQPAGVNGLPPREVQTQGYQQFDVYDATGSLIGRVDADVFTQWDLFGVYSESLLITGVAEGTAGADAGQVPPTGSVYEFVYFGNSGFGAAYSAVPSVPRPFIASAFLTPFGAIPLFTKYDASDGLTGVSYFDPFVAL